MAKATIGDLEGGAALCAWFEGVPSFQTKHVAVTLTIFDLIEVELFEFMEAGIMDGLNVEIDHDGVTLSFESSYGVHGRIKAKRVAVEFEPRQAE